MRSLCPTEITTSANISVSGLAPMAVTLIKSDKVENKSIFFVPTYDMSKVHVNKYFTLSEKEEKIYHIILQSLEGSEELNKLKNSVTNNIINNFLRDVEEKTYVRIKEKQEGFKHVINSMIECPLEGNNLICHKSIGITKKQIWQHFLSVGLVEKFRKLIK